MPDNRVQNRVSKIFLLATAIIFVPVSLTYGFLPEGSLRQLFGINAIVDNVNLKNMMRALMGLYLAMVVFWITGAIDQRYRLAALRSLTVFMFGVAIGRGFSFLLDGWPAWPFIFFFVSEILLGFLGLRLLRKT